jgi:hypothetical protein
MQSDQDLENLPKRSKPKNRNLPADRRARRRVMDEMRRDAPVDEKAEAEELEHLSKSMRL